MIYVALYRGRSWFPSRLIRWLTWSVYSHASIVHYNGATQTIYEAWQGMGVWKHTKFVEGHKRGKKTRVDLFEFVDPLTVEQHDLILRELESQLGRHYDWRGVISFLLRRRMQNDRAWFCSELIAHCCAVAGRPLLRAKPWQVSPRDLALSVELRMDRCIEI